MNKDAKTENVPGGDAIEKEIHSVREAYARQFGYDIHGMFEDLRKKQKRSGRKIVSFPPKRLAEGPKKEAP